MILPFSLFDFDGVIVTSSNTGRWMCVAGWGCCLFACPTRQHSLKNIITTLLANIYPKLKNIVKIGVNLKVLLCNKKYFFLAAH